MKKLDKRWLLFLVLILLLATGLPYLSLHQEASTTIEEPDDVQTMSIALVNEDEGAVFNNNELTFGDAFVRSLDNNDEHNWFVVSRGVAESGLNRNTYDMMIVIPNDFSVKALSIDSESPEQVVLNYRINASEDEYVKAEAEKTASTILNDFNQRIIDVYFASIIGNLQDAQDNIGEIVTKQTQYTNTYNNDINNPLSNYTNQFGMIKDNTQVSRDNFDGLEDMLEGFENRLAEGAETNQSYLSNLDDFSNIKEANNSALLSFSDALLQFNNILNHQDANQNLEQLQRANNMINNQFRLRDNEAPNIATETIALKNHLSSSLDRVKEANKVLQARLGDELEDDIEDYLSDILGEALDGQEEPLKMLFKSQDKVAREQIKEQISRLPSLDEDDFIGYGLPDDTVREIRNVIAVANKHNEEFEHVASRIDNDEILAQHIDGIKNHLHENGVTMSDSVELPKNEKKGQVFKLDIPDEYELINLTLSLPGHGEENYTERYQDNGKLKLPTNEKGIFEINVTLKLIDTDSEIDIFQPVKWGWELHQKDINNVDHPDDMSTKVPNTTLVASTSTGNNSEEDKSVASEKKTEEQSTPDENSEESDEDKSQNSDEVVKEGTDSNGTDAGTEDTTNDEAIHPAEDTDPEDGDEPEIEKVKVINNHIRHEVTNPVTKMDNATKDLIHVVTNTVSSYQRLFSTFESYFGLDMNMNPNRLQRQLRRNSLEDLAADTSLYSLFNKKDTGELVKDYIVGEITESITAEIRNPLEFLQKRIDRYEYQVTQANRNADRLVERVIETAEEAENLNNNLAETLEKVALWRENSMNLLEEHSNIQANDSEEQAVIMTLSNDFQPLLSESQSLADQAQGNLSNSESVYQTLDTIDNQAETIEQSGADLVTQADQLSADMTNKILEDQEFVENFSGVLANSRIGERQNETLYNFLSNPVQTSNEGTITSGNNFTPYFLVLTNFIIALFTAYVISTLHLKRLDDDQFAQEKSLIGKNTPITLITAGIGVLEGITIGIISSYLLKISDGSMVLWTGLITVLMLSMLMIATYLLRQLKMIGMFVLLIVLSMYLFLTNAFGTGLAGMDQLKAYSPLQYVENLLLQAVQGNANYLLAIPVIIGLIILGTVANLLVLSNRQRKGDLSDEGSAEAS